MSSMYRHSINNTGITVSSSIGSSTAIPFSDRAGGTVQIPNGVALTAIAFHASNDDGTTYDALYDKDGNAVSITVAADRVYPFPEATYGCQYLKMVGTFSSGTSGTVYVNLKG